MLVRAFFMVLIVRKEDGGCKGNCKDGLNQNLAGDPKLIYSAIIMSQV